MISRLLKLSLFSGFIFACNPNPFMEEGKNPRLSSESKHSKKGKGKKNLSDLPESLPDEPASPDIAAPPSEEVNLYLKVSDLQTSLSRTDVQSLRQIAANPERSPLQRATLLFGALRAYVREGVSPVLFEQAALTERTPVQGKNWTDIKSLEALFQETNLSFRRELESNPFVQNFAIVALMLRALDQETDKGSPFASELRAELHQKAEQWIQVREKLAEGIPGITAPVANPSDLAKAVPSPETVPAPEAVASAPESSVNTAGLKDPELLKKSAELAEKNHFQESIQILRRISPKSLYAAEAKGKIRDIANKAVSDLRTKAARAYQSAVPIADLKARSNYLTQAQNYLLKAIEEFPESDQIESVRQNLNTIQKNLNVINKN